MTMSRAHRDRYRAYYAARDIPVVESRWCDRVEDLAVRLQAKTILDYGCGPARGLSSFSTRLVYDYDPGVPELAARPARADLVVCIHMLEHVEDAQHLGEVMDDLHALAKRALFVVASCQESTKLLPDGTPWHTFVRPAGWWRIYLSDLGFVEQPVLRDEGQEYAALKVIG